MEAIRRSTSATRPRALSLFVMGAALWLAGCHHQRQTVAYQPLPPAYGPARQPEAPRAPAPTAPPRDSAAAAGDIDSQWSSAPAGFFDDISSPPVYTEDGVASWYITDYHGRAMADGTMGVQTAMTAAHRTLPMGSTLLVTSLTTGQQVLVRVTDRGPFVPGRSLDLSQGAAKAIGLYRAGVGRVRIEAFAHPGASPEGRWCVQTGAFASEQEALDLKSTLIRHYRGAQVSEFHGMTGYWVRIDPEYHDKASALAMQRWIGGIGRSTLPYLVRVD